MPTLTSTPLRREWVSAPGVGKALLIVGLLVAREGAAQSSSPATAGFYGQGEGSLSPLARAETSGTRLRVARSQGMAVRSGYRWGDYSLFGSLEANSWRSPRLEGDDDFAMALNLGVGAERLSYQGFVRTSIALGPSMLVIPTDMDEGGETGFFVDLRPLGLRWRLLANLVVGLDPLSFSLLVPVLSRVPLVEVQYRTSIYCEVPL